MLNLIKKAKKLSLILCVITVLLTLVVFSGCNVEEPAVWSSDNPNIMIFNGLVPKPDKISLYKCGEEKELNSDTNDFNKFWKTVNNLFNGKPKYEPIDSLFDKDRIADTKQSDICFELEYNKIYMQENSSRMFNGLFCYFETYNLIFGFYSVDENGNYLTTEDGGIYFTDFYSISYSGNKKQINKILDLINNNF